MIVFHLWQFTVGFLQVSRKTSNICYGYNMQQIYKEAMIRKESPQNFTESYLEWETFHISGADSEIDTWPSRYSLIKAFEYVVCLL